MPLEGLRHDNAGEVASKYECANSFIGTEQDCATCPRCDCGSCTCAVPGVGCFCCPLVGDGSDDDPRQVVRGLLQRRLPAAHVGLFELVLLSAPANSANVSNSAVLSERRGTCL